MISRYKLVIYSAVIIILAIFCCRYFLNKSNPNLSSDTIISVIDTKTSSTKKPYWNNVFFDNSGSVLIVLSPHFDDAVLSVGGILSEFAGQKYVVTFFSTPTTTKQYLTWWDRISGFEKSSDSHFKRMNENNNALKIIGTQAINENYLDGQYENRTSSTSAIIVNNIIQNIDEVINSMGSTSVVVLGPSYFGEKDTHKDHALLSKAFAQVIKNKTHNNTVFYFFEDLPYTYSKFGNSSIKLQEILSNFYPELTFSQKVLYISQKSFDLKIMSMKSYTSQLKAFSFLNEDLLTNIFNFETNRCSPLICEVIYEAK